MVVLDIGFVLSKRPLLQHGAQNSMGGGDVCVWQAMQLFPSCALLQRFACGVLYAATMPQDAELFT